MALYDDMPSDVMMEFLHKKVPPEKNGLWVRYSGKTDRSERKRLKEQEERERLYLQSQGVSSQEELNEKRAREYQEYLENFSFFEYFFDGQEEKMKKYIYIRLGMNLKHLRNRLKRSVEQVQELGLNFDVSKMEAGHFKEVDIEGFQKVIGFFGFEFTDYFFKNYKTVSGLYTVREVMRKRGFDSAVSDQECKKYAAEELVKEILSIENIKKYGYRS
jgi:hypothetical protein